MLKNILNRLISSILVIADVIMWKYILKRLISLVPVIAGVILIVYLIMFMAPGDPAMQALGDEATDTDARNALLEQAVILANEQVYQIPLHLATMIRAHNANLVVPEHASTDFPLYLNMVYWRR